MGVTRSAPWWLTWALFAGLVLIFTGERVIGGAGSARAIFSILGSVVVLATVAWRFVSWRAAQGEARRAETTLLVAYGGIVLALLLYLLSSTVGMRWFGIEFETDDARHRYTGAIGVLWTILLAASLLPALAAQVALGAHRHAKAAGAGMEALRVRGMARSGLTVALAGAFLIVTGYVVTQRDRSLDLSYFRTSSPGDGTLAVVGSMDSPLRVLFFYPEINPVKDEAMRYFRSLAASIDHVSIEAHDRLARPDLAREYSVTEDGVIVLTTGNRTERMLLGVEFDNATRNRLRTLDGEVNRRMLSLLRDERVVYFTTGHGELNDPASAGALASEGLGGVDVLQEMIRALNNDVANLGLTTGLAEDIPDDAAAVVILGPQRPFLDEELAALERYLGRGGSLLIALDRESPFELGTLERRLGVRLERDLLVDDLQHLIMRQGPSDRQLIFTNRYSSHEVVTTVARASVESAVVFFGSGHLVEVDTDDDWDAISGSFVTDSAWLAADEFESPRPYFIVRSMPTTFADLDNDFEFDDGTEFRQQYNLIAAVESLILDSSTGDGGEDAATAGGGTGAAAGGALGAGEDIAAVAGVELADDESGAPEMMRALVVADARIFTDAVLSSFGLNAALVADGIRWLGGEEQFAGAAQSEEDVPIRHTRAEDVAWFYSTILGAPALVLILGLTGVYIRRRRRSRAEMATGVVSV